MFLATRRSLRLSIFISIAVVILLFSHPNPRIHNLRTIQFEHKSGSFDEQLFSLFSLLGVARSLGRTPVFNAEGKDAKLIKDAFILIGNRFPTLSEQFKIVIEPDHSPNAELGLEVNSSFEDPVEKFSRYTVPEMMVLGNGFRSFKYFHHLRPEIRQWMLGNAENVQEARSLLLKHQRDAFKICVHNENNMKTSFDFDLVLSALHGLLEDYSKKHERLLMVFSSDVTSTSRKISDSPTISKFNFDKMYLVSSPPEVQLTFSRIYCDVVFLTVPTSTYGFWMAYLAKEEDSPVWYADNQEDVRDDFIPPNWQKFERT